jgi:hypothetical protein
VVPVQVLVLVLLLVLVLVLMSSHISVLTVLRNFTERVMLVHWYSTTGTTVLVLPVIAMSQVLPPVLVLVPVLGSSSSTSAGTGSGNGGSSQYLPCARCFRLSAAAAAAR